MVCSAPSGSSAFSASSSLHTCVSLGPGVRKEGRAGHIGQQEEAGGAGCGLSGVKQEPTGRGLARKRCVHQPPWLGSEAASRRRVPCFPCLPRDWWHAGGLPLPHLERRAVEAAAAQALHVPAEQSGARRHGVTTTKDQRLPIVNI